jgi:hypothetical protein
MVSRARQLRLRQGTGGKLSGSPFSSGTIALTMQIFWQAK